MHKKILIFILMTLIVFTFVACKKDEATEGGLLNPELVKLLPNEDFRWAYIGPAEYYHEMNLESITKDENQAIYKVVGEVENVSNGETNSDYSIELFYEVDANSIVQKKTEETMLDSEYDQITLIKTPLEEGTSWTEEIKDRNGEKQTITATIIEVKSAEKGMVYKVVYQNKKTGYVESRKIMDGFGVIAFTKTIKVNGEDFNVGYGLYGQNSGYIARSTEPTGDGDTVVDSGEDTTTDDSTDSEDDGDDTTTDSGTSDDADTSDDEDNTPAVDDKLNVENAIKAFNNAWIKLVNNNDQSFFDYVTTNGIAYKNAKNFDSAGLHEEFLVMNVTHVTVNGNVATAKVREEIKKTKDGEVTIAKYDWLYDLVKKDGEWLINGYTKQ